MKKVLLAALLVGGFITSQAQTWVADSVIIGAGYANRAFYSLQNGVQGSVLFNNRDWLVQIGDPYSASIRINGGFNAALYKYTAGDTADWNILDTAGISTSTGWERCRDNRESFYPSAFEQGATSHPDYGWGTYNDVTHFVEGSKLFVYKTVGTGSPNTSEWKKVWIKELNSQSIYNILVADLDGSNEETINISKQGASDKNFVYYSFATHQVTNDEPSLGTYDLVFTKHEDYYTFGGAPSLQAVTGVESAPGTLVAKADNVIPNDAQLTDYTLGEDIYGIGADWKTVNTQTFGFDMEDSLSYFVQDQTGSIWQIRFTGFVGSSAGKYRFDKRIVAHASVEETEAISAWTIFPNPTSDYASIVFSSNTADMGQFNLIDLNGRTVMTQSINVNTGLNQFTFDLTGKNIPAGIYVAALRAGSTYKTTKLIIR